MAPTCRRLLLSLMLAALLSPGVATRAGGQEPVSFPATDGGVVHALRFGESARAVVLAHGGRFNKESWDAQARVLAAAGFQALAIDLRGYGQSRGPADAADGGGRHHDVLGAVRYLRQRGAISVAVIGASMGGDASAEAAETDPGAIDRLILIAAGAYTPLRRMPGPKLFIMSRDDVIGDEARPRMPAIRAQFERASDPKTFVELPGTAHAQAIFATPQGDALMREILAFLSQP